MPSLVCDWVSEAWNSEKRSAVEILHESFLVDGSRHEHDFQRRVPRQQIFQFEKQKITIRRPFVNLTLWIVSQESYDCDIDLHLVNYDVRHALKAITRRKPSKDDTSGAEKELCMFVLFAFAPDCISNRSVLESFCGDTGGN